MPDLFKMRSFFYICKILFVSGHMEYAMKKIFMSMYDLLIMAISKHFLTILLFIYHLFFIALAYVLRVQRGTSDAHLYWGMKFQFAQYDWLDFASYGTDFILFLNYPFVRLGLPFWFGFLMYGVIGFFGIMQWVRWSQQVMGKMFIVKGINLLPFFYFLPNLHVWTASLGKEALVFWGITSVFYGLAVKKYKSLGFIFGWIILSLIRPHVALMLVASLALILFFDTGYPFKKKVLVSVGAIALLPVLLYMILQLSKIRYWNWDRISYFNDYSVLSFKGSGSYVPMLDYNIGYKLFSLNFRPLFFDADTFLQYLASVENSLILLLFVSTVYIFIRYYKSIKLRPWFYLAVIFTLISGLLFVQRYANLGIFMRTKMMFQPFMIISFLYVIRQRIMNCVIAVENE